MKVKRKTNLSFYFYFIFALFTPYIHIITKIPFNFFFKIVFLLSQPHHFQVFTRLPLPSIPQPQWTTYLMLLIHLKSIYTLSFSLWTKNNISFTLPPYSSKKLKLLIQNFLWFIEPFKHTIFGGLLSFEVLGGWRRLCVLRKSSD